MALNQHLFVQEDRDSHSSTTMSSVESLLPKPLQSKRRVKILFALLVPTTLVMLGVCVSYSLIAGRAGYWYNKPDSWQFCVVYADQTVQLWNKKLISGVPSMLSYLGLVNVFYAWAGVAASFRALFHYEWIPSTVAFLLFNVFGQLCYYQGTTLVVVPPKLVLSLLAVTKWFSVDMYDDLGYFCTDSGYAFTSPPLIDFSGDIIKRPVPNCTDSVVVINEAVQDAGDDLVRQLQLLQNSTVPDKDLDCGGAVALHFTFLVCCYILVAITLGVMLILIFADREIRAPRPERHFFKEKSAGLEGAHVCLWLVAVASAGYVVSSVALCDAALAAVHNTRDYALIRQDTAVAKGISAPLLTGELSLKITLDYDVRTYLPFVTNQLSIQTVLLIVVVMSVLRGAFKRSISAFRLGGVASLLAVIVQWPPLAGNLETMKYQKLWWWDPQEQCNTFHSGAPYFDPKENGPYGSQAYCEDSRWAVLGAFITFVALHLNMVACAFVYRRNQYRESLVVEDALTGRNSGIGGGGEGGEGHFGPEDPFALNLAGSQNNVRNKRRGTTDTNIQPMSV